MYLKLYEANFYSMKLRIFIFQLKNQEEFNNQILSKKAYSQLLIANSFPSTPAASLIHSAD